MATTKRPRPRTRSVPQIAAEMSRLDDWCYDVAQREAQLCALGAKQALMWITGAGAYPMRASEMLELLHGSIDWRLRGRRPRRVPVLEFPKGEARRLQRPRRG